MKGCISIVAFFAQTIRHKSGMVALTFRSDHSAESDNASESWRRAHGDGCRKLPHGDMNATDALFLTVFGKPWPKAKKGLHSSETV